jgi:hypothetical protein
MRELRSLLHSLPYDAIYPDPKNVQVQWIDPLPVMVVLRACMPARKAPSAWSNTGRKLVSFKHSSDHCFMRNYSREKKIPAIGDLIKQQARLFAKIFNLSVWSSMARLASAARSFLPVPAQIWG